ncbi:glycoside hydrolase family 2 TIM barrel-domain containing protein [Flammeovirga sp. SJP92]|uniref:glycoside hydrolase family 2 TIM barrel-domain containing protein n=1 Tax=Flammeovirga sp. SJP92 TaxID=1775430 RepID=UPI0007893AB9|nr:glycoside hydrolase family 2 TIM barrel-domain containing protein [Flammeovirga sp. SJP92]KXX69291.1 threonine synthase [Flammeovirga sp. SJP92]
MKGLIVLLLGIWLMSCSQQQTNLQREIDFNFDWKFTLVKDTLPPTQVPLVDQDWRAIRLPHDWSVEASFDSTLEGCVGYLPGGVGIYQKHFKTPVDLKDNNVFILFDGVYNNATFWINGRKLGFNPYGYSPLYFDLSSYLHQDDKDNVITVHVDHSRFADSRWYAGSGIYRNVKLVTVDKLHIPIWGTFITTPEVTKEQSKVHLQVELENHYATEQKVEVVTSILDENGKSIVQTSSHSTLKSNQKNKIEQDLTVKSPKLWSPDTPVLYNALTQLKVEGKVVDEYSTPFGIRSIEFKVNEGFYLNGENTLVKGVCLHHDAGLVGTAVPLGVWERRLRLLKEGGVNAIRTSHNPFSKEFLDLCDRMGFLVQNELFDEFDYPKDKRQNFHDRHSDYATRGYDEYFQKWAKSDLQRTMRRDRNHPSVFQWSIGNEIEWTYLHYRYITGFYTDPENPNKNKGFFGKPPMFTPEELKVRYDNWEKGDYILAKTAQKLNDWAKEMDDTRPTTANLIIPQVSHVSGYADAVDIPGYSYRNVIFPWAKKYFPDTQVTTNECPGTWDDWKQVLEYPGVFSIFMWTGIDYIGERNDRWPEKSAWGDMLDLAGFKVTGWNYFKSIWKDEPHISIGTIPLKKSGFKAHEMSGLPVAKKKNAYKWRNSNWHWNYKKGEQVLVEVTSNYSTVELLLNGKSLGYRSMSDSPGRIMRWVVPFEEGELVARAKFGKEETVTTLKTAGKPVKTTITADKKQLKADAYDVSHIVFQLEDKDGYPVKTENVKVTFEVEGNAKLLGVDNGAWTNIQDFKSNTLTTSKGRALTIIQSTKEAGDINITAKVDGYPDQTIMLKSSK